ncbi:MAG TPA: peptidoglycan bridge formation glycyltransferase FemA/FemB family protein [Bacteroidia bacterium]|nr:peptidoglycan bridge formation glycyltransferase FemA/FemB family protein [Bacteroidia bacterium]
MAIEIIDAKEQNIFVHLNSDENPIFFTSEYHQFEQQNGYKTGFFVQDNQIFMPFRVYKKWMFIFIQIMYPPIKRGERLNEVEEKEFLNACVFKLKTQKKYHRIIQPFVWDVFNSFPDKATYCHFGQLFSKIDDITDQEVFDKFSPKYKNAIRKVLSNKELVDLKENSDELIPFYEIYEKVHAKQGVYYDALSHFERMQKILAPRYFNILNLYYQNQLEGGAIVIYTKKEAYYLYGGANNPTIQNGSIKLLQFEIIKKLKKNGVKKYIWGGCRLSDVSGTKQQGMQEFKLRFGSEIKKGYLWKIDIHKGYCFWYDLLISFQHKLKGKTFIGDVIDYEKNREVII